jgi:hypothetical protein
VQGCPWLAKCPAGSASADISLGGFFALFLILLLLWLAYVAFSAYIKCAAAPTHHCMLRLWRILLLSLAKTVLLCSSSNMQVSGEVHETYRFTRGKLLDSGRSGDIVVTCIRELRPPTLCFC